jgi:two-component system chemotaxis sensor kinase CheA
VDQDTLLKQLMATFLDELEENVAALNRDLLALEKDPAGTGRAERLRTLFRTAHSLKGAARSVNVGLIESACHRMEALLAAARDGQVPLGPELFSVLFAAADALDEAKMRLREGPDLSGTLLSAVIPRLEAAAQAGSGPASAHPQEKPPAPPVSEPVPPKPDVTVEAPPAGEPGASGGPSSGFSRSSTPDRLKAELQQGEPETPPAGSVGGPATVRVAAEKLDTFLARNGELLAARQRVQARAEELAALRDFVARWKTEWRAAEKPLAAILHAQESPSSPASVPRSGGEGSTMRPSGNGRLPRRAAEVLGRVGTHLRQLEKDLERLVGAVIADGRFLKEAAGAIDEEVRRVRLLPFAEACQGLDRMVRDLTVATGKEVELVLEGGDVELDRSVLEGLKDPLRHLVRNAVDHGGEPPGERRAAGKPAALRLTVAAVLRGTTVEVSVADDGRGLDLDALRQQARRRHLPEPADDRETARLVFLPGMSTAALVTDVSGRGVGLDVVKSRAEWLHGTVDLASTPGRGTRFTLSVPLTLTTLRVLLVTAGGQTFALPGSAVQKLVRVDPARVRAVEGRPMLALGDTPVPLASLAGTLGLRGPEAAGHGSKPPAVILTAGDRRVAFVVDDFQAEQEVVVKSLGARVRRLPHVWAATILPSGRIAPVLNAVNLVRSALRSGPSAPLAAAPERAAPKAKKRILVAEDSLTTRTLVKSILEAAGYEATAVGDGALAWQALQEQGADLLVSDVEMPHMDGFALTEAVRASRRFHDLPVVLVTARESEADKARGIAVQADAYLGKSGFDQKRLLETIGQLL